MPKDGYVDVFDKQKYLNDNYPFQNVPLIKEQRKCIHCDQIITVGDYKVFIDKKGNEFIVCPNSPDCDGTVIDWMSIDNK
jgi:ssDNA-binding Zn-finger/Zn-ribbon topoisomerase 1